MIFDLYQPAFPLSQFVEHFYYYEGYQADHRIDRFLPDGNTEFIINLKDDVQHIYDNETLRTKQACRHAWVSGIRTQAISIPSGHESRMLIISFKKGKAYPFYGLPLRELTDTVVEADLLWGAASRELRERLMGMQNAKSMFLLLERFLLQLAKGKLVEETPAKCVQFAIDHIIAQPEILSLKSLSQQIGYSQKHLIELFKQQVGVSPKAYLRILRFQKAIVEIENDPSLDWSRLANDCGYYDQAHFINDFKAFSGFTPNDYFRKKSDLLNYVPVG